MKINIGNNFLYFNFLNIHFNESIFSARNEGKAEKSMICTEKLKNYWGKIVKGER